MENEELLLNEDAKNRLEEEEKEKFEKIFRDVEEEYFNEHRGKYKERYEVSPEQRARQQEIYDLANSGDAEKRRCACERLIKDVNDYILYVIGHVYNTVNMSVVDEEDVRQQTYLHIINSIESYNPEYSITTFAGNKIKQAMQESRSKQSGMTSYYLQRNNAISAAINAFSAKGIANPTPKDIAIATNLSLKTIVNTMGQKYVSNTKSLSDNEYDDSDKDKDTDINSMDQESISSYRSSPESLFFNKERSEDLRSALASLEEIELKVFIRKALDKVAWIKLANETNIQQEQLKKIYKTAQKKLFHSPHLSVYKWGNKDSEARFNRQKIATCPITEAISLLDDIDLLDGVEEGTFVEEVPDFGIRTFGEESDNDLD